MLTKTARTPEEAASVCELFISMLPKFRGNIEFIRDYMLKGYSLIMRLKTNGIALYSVDLNTRLAFSDTKHMNAIYDAPDLNA